MSYYVNPDIKKTERVFPPQGRLAYHRYDCNENPEGLPKEFIDEVLAKITPEFVAAYPEPDRFVKKYSDFIGVKPENVVTTNGSDMAIRYLLETFGEKGKSVVTVSPSFEMYWVNCSLLGLKHVPVAYESDMTINVDKIINSIDEDTSVVVLLNPNSPVGNVYTYEEVERVILRAREVDALVIIDEAYYLFYPISFLNLAFAYDNVVVTRTFSKLFSLAACRIGVVIGNEKLIHYVKNIRLTYDVNSFALLFAESILDRPEIIQQLIDEANEGKKYVLDLLADNGYECRDGRGNYILVKTKTDAHEVSRRLEKEAKVLVHPYGNELLKDYIRVSVGSKSAMEIFAKEFLKIDSRA